MTQGSQRPILVTGAHRSGTTWVGKMLAASPGVAYISEPLNVLHRPGVFGGRTRYWYTYICAENEAEFLQAFKQLLNYDYHLRAELRSLHSGHDFLRMLRDFGIFYRGSMQGARPLLKDPFAIFSLPWFAERLDCQIVVTVRHPAAFASSLKRLKWTFDFGDLLDQPLLMRDFLEPYRPQMTSIAADDIVGQAGLLWTMIYGIVWKLRSEIPALQCALHEELSLAPAEGFQHMYERLGLSFTPGALKTIRSSSSSANPGELGRAKVHSVQLDSKANLGNWKRRLTPDEIVRLRKLTQEVAAHYYPEASWN